MKRNILIIGLMVFFTLLNAKSITLVLDNDGSDVYVDENYILKKFLKVENLKRLGFETIYLIKERDKAKSYLISDDETPNNSHLNADKLGIIDGLEKVLSRKYTKDDLIIFLSRMNYHDKSTKTDSRAKIYNDAWITSDISPIKKVIDRYPNSPLNGAKIIVIDPSKDLKYLNKRERFFSFLFDKVGGRLLLYSGLDFDKLRINDYILSTKELHKLTQTPPLREEEHLMLDDEVIRYVLP